VRYRAVLEYDGADFRGWQRQAGRRSVQGCLEQALLDITGSPTTVVGAGRTDSGVHATGQVAHFDSVFERPAEELARALNAVLARDVSVRQLAPVVEHFHARHVATSRTYRYRLLVDEVRRPTERRRSWHVGPVDPAAIAGAAMQLIGKHDFGGFGTPPLAGGSTIREVSRYDVLLSDDSTVELVVQANAFLRHQVRRMTGLLVEVGRGRRGPADVASILAGGVAAPVRRAPPQGLVLEKVDYPADPAEWRTRSESEDMDAQRE
jgi:tRNA pseudouridine38-40 synthase